MRTIGSVIVALTAWTVLSAPLAGAVAVDRHVLTPVAPGTLTDQVVPLTGSPWTLVYSQQHRMARDVDLVGELEGGPTAATGSRALMARDAAGEETRLGHLRVATQYFSMVGETVAASSIGAAYPGRVVDVWDLSAGTHVRERVPAGGRFLAAAPGGYAYVTPGGVVRTHTIDGVDATLAAPFSSATDHIFGGAGDAGIVVGDPSGTAFYIPWADPHTATQLTNPTEGQVHCRSVVDGYAACTLDYRNEEQVLPGGGILFDLATGAATVADESRCVPPTVAVAGSTLMWPCPRPDQPTVLATQRFGEPAATVTDTPVEDDLASAYGEVVAATPSLDQLFATSDGQDQVPVAAAAPSPVSADAFALTRGRIVYSDDERVHGDPAAVTSVFARHVAVHRGHLEIGPPHRISATGERVSGNIVLASRHASVYATFSPHSTPDATDQSLTLHVRSHKYHDAVIRRSYGRAHLSGHRLVFHRYVDNRDRLKVYNLRTRRTTAVHVRRATNSTVALSGRYLAYADPKGRVHRLDLRTGNSVRLSRPLPTTKYGMRIAMYAARDYVGWDACIGYRDRRCIGRSRNARTLAPAARFHRRLYALTPKGALLDSTATFENDVERAVARSGLVTSATRFWLKAYGGRTRSLLSPRAFAAGPQVVSGVVAWVTPTGQLLSAVDDR